MVTLLWSPPSPIGESGNGNIIKFASLNEQEETFKLSVIMAAARNGATAKRKLNGNSSPLDISTPQSESVRLGLAASRPVIVPSTRVARAINWARYEAEAAAARAEMGHRE